MALSTSQLRVVRAQDTLSLLMGAAALSEGQRLLQENTPKAVNQAVVKFEEALSIFRKNDSKEGEIAALGGLGLARLQVSEGYKAIEYLEQAAAVARAAQLPFYEATALSGMAAAYASVGQYQKAVPIYERTLVLLSGDGEDVSARTMRGSTLMGLGITHVMLGEQAKGLARLGQALAHVRGLRDAPAEALLLESIGATYNSVGNRQEAMKYMNRSLGLARAIRDRGREANALRGLGRVHSDVGEYERALGYFNQALAIWRYVKNPEGESSVLGHIAAVHLDRGEYLRAVEVLRQSLRLKRDDAALNNLGNAYSSLGEFQKALEAYHEALALVRAENYRRGQAAVLANLGHFYLNFGEVKYALDHFNEALPIARAMGDPSIEASIIASIGGAYLEQGDRPQALDYFTQALRLRRALRDRSGVANSLINIAGIQLKLGQREKALGAYEEALEIAREINDLAAIAGALNNLGEVYRQGGDHRKALELYGQSLALVSGSGHREKEATTLSNIAAAELARGDLAAARARIEASLAITETLRAKVLDQQSRASFFAKTHQRYEFYVGLLMRLHERQPAEGYDRLALQASERGRARALLDVLDESRADIRQGLPPELLERERSVKEQLAAREAMLVKQLSRPHTAAQVAATKGEVESLLLRLREVESAVKASSPRYAALTQPQPPPVESIQRELGPDALLLEYSLGEAKSYLWVVDSGSVTPYVLPPRAEIEAAARRLYELLTVRKRAAPGMDPEARRAQLAESDARLVETAAQLSRMILAPAAAKLGGKRLLIVADGALQYIPFAALPAPPAAGNADARAGEPLVVSHEIVSLPAASVIVSLRRERGGRRPPAKTLAVIADPVFSGEDERVRGRAGLQGPATDEQRELTHERPGQATASEPRPPFTQLRIRRLLGTRQEADRILSQVPPAESFRAVDFEANLAAATAAELGRYRYVHFATHGYLDTLRPELSAVVFSLVDEHGRERPGFLRLHEVYGLKLPVEMVVLSACETGLGKEVRGEGLMGLTRGFMYAGSPRVLVSLWSVQDRATADLMEKLYRGLLAQKLTPVAALRAAQIEMLRGKEWASPFYWAAFTLHGEWH